MSAQRLLAITALIVLAACGGKSPSGGDDDDDDDDDDNNLPGAMHARINGVNWSSSAQAIGLYNASGHTYIITGAELGISPARAINLSLTGIEGPGTYPLGTGLPFRYGNVVISGSAWETSVAQGAASSGTVTVTIATPTHIVGTFSFTGVPASNNPNATGTATVTNGTFDITMGN